MLKQFILCVSFLSLATLVSAQRPIIPSDKPAISITNECRQATTNVWYGITNRFKVIVEGYRCDSLTIYSEYFDFTYLGNCYYDVTVKDTSLKEWPEVYIQKGSFIDTTIWNWDFLPTPQASLSIGHAYMFLFNKLVIADYHNCAYSQLNSNCFRYSGRRVKFETLSYTVEILRGDSSLGKFNSEGPQIYKLKKQLGIVKPEDKLVFTNMMVKGPDGIIREAFGFEHTVK